MLTDPIADYLTRIRNALRSDKDQVQIPASRLKRELTRILEEQGYILGHQVEPADVGEVIRIRLKYTKEGIPAIQGLERVSRPGRRRYVGREDVPRVRGGMGTVIISTPAGVMSGHAARAQGIGGEVVAYVW
jgi:small subunit ribosomal protein S8